MQKHGEGSASGWRGEESAPARARLTKAVAALALADVVLVVQEERVRICASRCFRRPDAQARRRPGGQGQAQCACRAGAALPQQHPRRGGGLLCQRAKMGIGGDGSARERERRPLRLSLLATPSAPAAAGSAGSRCRPRAEA